MRFSKYQALGNDYIVINPGECTQPITTGMIKVICNRRLGVGSDGILYGPKPSVLSDFALQIFNPDSSEAEKSGNGLRIFSRYLWDQALVKDHPFTVETAGGEVTAQVKGNGETVSVEMGKVLYTHERTGKPSPRREVLILEDREITYYPASVGNPHCVIFVDKLSEELPIKYGPAIENHPRFRNRTNVQFVEVLDRTSIKIEIWERGAGYTLASGSSSTAAAAVAHALGKCDANIKVSMPGGIIDIVMNQKSMATMIGPVCKVCEGFISAETMSLSVCD